MERARAGNNELRTSGVWSGSESSGWTHGAWSELLALSSLHECFRTYVFVHTRGIILGSERSLR